MSGLCDDRLFVENVQMVDSVLGIGQSSGCVRGVSAAQYEESRITYEGKYIITAVERGRNVIEKCKAESRSEPISGRSSG